MIGKIDYNLLILDELQRIENLSPKYEAILRLISKRIRGDLWRIGENDVWLYKMLYECGAQLDIDYKENGKYTEEMFLDYVWYLRPYTVFLNLKLQPLYFEKFISDIRLENAKVIIEKQWDDIICASHNCSKAFIEIFDDIFTKCLEKYEDTFIYKMSKNDVLCRAVPDWNWDESRFVPWDNKYNINRWNPPGKTYLYLSFEKKERKYSDKLSVNEYICLEECRAKKGNKYSFCNFEAVTEGRILDLSYNDVELWKIQMSLEKYEEVIEDFFVKATLSDQKKMKKMGTSRRSVKRYIKRNVNENIIDKSIIEVAVAKQYLKMVCNTIYKKVDENDNEGKNKAYKSFHILASYLETKGITGILYPCTRTRKIVGKNIVLFSRYDAIPIEGSIREIIY